MEGDSGGTLIKRMHSDGILMEQCDILVILREFTLRAKEGPFRESLTHADIHFLTDYLKQSVDGLTGQESPTVSCCIECVRCLRNICVHSEKNQEAVSGSSAIPALRQLLRFLLARTSLDEPDLVLLRCSIQLMVNVASGFLEGQKSVWKDIIHDLMHPLLSIPDEKVTQYCCMLIHTVLECPDNRTSFTETIDAGETFEAIIAASSVESDHDFCLQFVQFTLQSWFIIPSLFDKLSISSQISLLHVASACIATESHQQGPATAISESTLACIAQKFKSMAHHILTLAMKDNDGESKTPQLVMSLLDVLCAASAEPNLQPCLQNMDFVVDTTVELLDMVEQVGRSSNNAFTVRQNVTAPAYEAAIAAEPGYGFKRNLVQLIGNMCFRHRGNQDRVRELKGISTILQQCNIDSKNAFISQWAILAIRNLCENNPDNQAFLLSLRREGVADNEALARLGYEAALRADGQIYLKNLKK